MFRKTSSVLFLVVLSLVVALPAFAQAPNFSAGVYADGQAWGTKGTTDLPAPTAHNLQSYDIIVAIMDGAEGQLPVAEAAPGNPMYNGGRWRAYTGTWDSSVVNPPLITSYDELMQYVDSGLLSLENNHNYFQCPLLPVK
jgi:hypothetical protein